MPDLKISQLPVATTPLAGTELVPIVQGGTTDQTTVQAILTGTVPSGTANGVTYLNGSKVLTSGSALTFDGTTLGLTGRFNVTAATNQRYSDFNTTSAGYGFSSYSYNGTAYGYVAQASATFGGGSNTDFALSAVNSLVFGANSSEQMRLTSTGLGIGTSSPATKLQVANGAIRLTDGYELGWGDNSAYITGSGASDTIQFITSSAERMRLDSSGNLGLGVTPKSGSGGIPCFEISGSGTGFTSQGAFNAFSQNVYYASGWKYAANGLAASYWQDAGVHKWLTAPSGTAGNTISFTQAMTLDASGNLLVGTTSSTLGRLEVVGGTGIRVNEDAAGTKVIQMRSAFAGGDPAINVSTNHALAFNTNNQERARITATGNVVAGGSVALATTATDGFLYVPTCAGQPTGTPTAITGMAPIVVDTTNNKMYFYSGGAWRDAGP